MDVLVNVVLPLALAFIMFSLGLGLSPQDFARVVRRPVAFGIGAVNQVILLPLVVFAVVIVFRVPAELAVGFMILAACPGGVTSNVISKLAKADVALSVSLTAIISLLSAVTVPVILAWSMARFMGADAPDVDVTAIALTMFALTVVPILMGLGVRLKAPSWSERAEPTFTRVSTLLFAVIVIAAVAANWDTVTQRGSSIGLALIVCIMVLMTLGFVLTRLVGLGRRAAKTISIETGIQNGTLGITVATLVMPVEGGFPLMAVPSAVYGLLMYVVAIPAVLLFRRLDHGLEDAT